MGKWDRATFPPSSAADGRQLTEQKSGRQMLLQLSQVFLTYQIHICLFDSHHISLCTCIYGSFDQLSLKKACRNCCIDTDISSNRHIHHQCQQYFFRKCSIFLITSAKKMWMILWPPAMRKMLLRLWNEFKRGTVVALHCIALHEQCNEMQGALL